MYAAVYTHTHTTCRDIVAYFIKYTHTHTNTHNVESEGVMQTLLPLCVHFPDASLGYASLVGHLVNSIHTPISFLRRALLAHTHTAGVYVCVLNVIHALSVKEATDGKQREGLIGLYTLSLAHTDRAVRHAALTFLSGMSVWVRVCVCLFVCVSVSVCV
jgi:hypothetical protein